MDVIGWSRTTSVVWLVVFVVALGGTYLLAYLGRHR